jgi:hypothetical protein
MELWSDVRFAHAHRLYAGRGYALVGQRTLTDPDRSVEFGFRRSLVAHADPVFPDAATAKRIPLVHYARPWEQSHRAAMIAAAILDSRSLVRGGRMHAGGHELPAIHEVFGAGSGPEIQALVIGDDVLAGFERAGERRIHPLFLPA